MGEKNYEYVDEIAAKYLQSIKEGVNNTGVQTGFRELDLKTGGFLKGEVTLIGARPSVGKTAFALTAARFLSVKNKRPVLLFSLEMTKEQVTRRIMLAESKVDCNRVSTGRMTEQAWFRLEMGCDAMKGAKLIIDDTPGMTVREICERTSELKKECGIELVIIDYYQLISVDNPLASRRKELAEIAMKLKALAKELDIPIVVLSQLSRTIDQRQDHHPLLSDLRVSGISEQYIDMVLFLYRDKYYNQNSKYNDVSELIIAKQRNGSCGTVYLEWHPENGEFTDLDEKCPIIKITPEEIIESVCEEFCVDSKDVLSKRRNAELVLPRQVIMYLCREYTDLSLDEIGSALGKKDHVSVMSGVEKIKTALSTDAQLSERIEHIKTCLG
jgi:replicative DNA helicase